MVEDPAKINQWLDLIFSYGPIWVYGIIFVACFIENIFPPFPGDSFIVAAGGLAAVSRLNFYLAFLTIIAGGVASAMVVYLIGKNYGREFFIKKNYKYFSASDIVKVENHFNKWGVLIIIFSRFVVGFRSALALVAGISRYQIVKMFLFTVISYILFAGLLMYAAFQFVENLNLIKIYFKTYNMIVWPILIILLTLYIMNKIKSLRKNRK